MTPPLNLIALRHGESEGNVANEATKAGDDRYFTEAFRARHSTTWRLTDAGVDQALAAGAWLRAHGPSVDRFKASPMARTAETAAVMDLPGARWHTDIELRERDWGELDVMTMAERRERFGEVLASRKKDPLLWAPPSGESIAAVDARVRAVLDGLARKPNRSILLVTHGEWMWALRLRLERMSVETWRALDASKDPYDRIHNAQILWYSRVDPESGDVSEKFQWVRSVCPWDTARSTNDWRRIERFAPTSAELLEIVRTSYPRMIA